MYRVMLVEDDGAVRYGYRKMKAWGENGFSITEEAANGRQAVDKIENGEIDIVFTDICMPLMDGISLMKKVREEKKQIPFIMVSSFSDFEYAREGLRLGALDYIMKPLEEKELEHALQRAKEVLGQSPLNHVMDKICQVCGEDVNPCDPLLKSLSRYLQENMKNSVTLEAAAEALNLNKDYLGKQIKAKTGRNFKDLYHSVQIAYAKTLLKNDNYKVYEISEMLGYTSADYFASLFKKVTGLSPAAYKKQVI